MVLFQRVRELAVDTCDMRGLIDCVLHRGETCMCTKAYVLSVLSSTDMEAGVVVESCNDRNPAQMPDSESRIPLQPSVHGR